ncbi:MAG: hypothetical protein GY705_29125 [Bacteroidetes bacterium]|nr:hypothetical protein [Bacteroidota bacterium]
MKTIFYLLIVACLFQACTPTKESNKAQEIVNIAIEEHGGNQYANLEASYVFRDKSYELKQSADGEFEYSRTFEKDGQQILDILTNEGLIRFVDEKELSIPDTTADKYASSVNSVHYFAFLPYRLNDPAVIKSYKGEITIQGKNYYAIEVKFHEEGGGEDHDDIFYYWFNAEEGTMDYFAYSYGTNGGGVRFRSVSKVQQVGGIRFQDYINYKAPVGTALESLPAMFENGELDELSRIELEQINVKSH